MDTNGSEMGDTGAGWMVKGAMVWWGRLRGEERLYGRSMGWIGKGNSGTVVLDCRREHGLSLEIYTRLRDVRTEARKMVLRPGHCEQR